MVSGNKNIFSRLQIGKAISEQPNFCRDENAIRDILENLQVEHGYIRRTGNTWTITLEDTPAEDHPPRDGGGGNGDGGDGGGGDGDGGNGDGGVTTTTCEVITEIWWDADDLSIKVKKKKVRLVAGEGAEREETAVKFYDWDADDTEIE